MNSYIFSTKTLILDFSSIFKPDRYIWKRIHGAGKRSQFKISNYGKNSDTILFYAKQNYYFNGEDIKIEYSKEYIDKKFKHIDKKGRYQRRSPFRPIGLGERPNLCYEYKGFKNPNPSGWTVSKEKLIEIDQAGDLEIVDNKIYRKLRLETSKGYPVNNIWEDIPQVMGKEKTDYSTQKPLKLLERIIKASCPKNGLVLDPFCGCATACIASEKLERKWIGIDLSPLAEKLVKKRLVEELDLSSTLVSIRKDILIKNALKPSKNIKHKLYGEQEGYCAGCKVHFQIVNLTIDHIVPKSKGGQDTDVNLQLLSGQPPIFRTEILLFLSYSNSIIGQIKAV